MPAVVPVAASATAVVHRVPPPTFEGTGQKFASFKLDFEAWMKIYGFWKVLVSPSDLSATDKELNSILFSYLILSVDTESKMLISAEAEDNGRKAWELLCRKWRDHEALSLLNVRNELDELKVVNGDIENYLTKLTNLALCLKQGKKPVSEEDLRNLILRRLPESYEQFVASAVLNPDLTLDTLKTQLTTVYKSRLARSTEKQEVEKQEDHSAMKAFEKKLKCFNCGKLGHISKECRNKEGKKKGRVECFHCGKPGHIAKFCRNKHPIEQRNDSSSVACISAEETSALSVSSESWIDSGATSHMCSEKSRFQNLRFDQRVLHGAFQGGSAKTVGVGTVIIEVKSENGKSICLKLEEVLYVPNLSGNLFSVSKAISKGHEAFFNEERSYLKINGANIPLNK
jgi:hypothetical protein